MLCLSKDCKNLILDQLNNIKITKNNLTLKIEHRLFKIDIDIQYKAIRQQDWSLDNIIKCLTDAQDQSISIPHKRIKSRDSRYGHKTVDIKFFEVDFKNRVIRYEGALLTNELFDIVVDWLLELLKHYQTIFAKYS